MSFRRSLQYANPTPHFELIQDELTIWSKMSLSICYHKQISIICEVEIKISKCSRLNMSETEQNRGNNNSLQQSKNSSEEFLVLVSILYVQVTLFKYVSDHIQAFTFDTRLTGGVFSEERLCKRSRRLSRSHWTSQLFFGRRILVEKPDS